MPRFKTAREKRKKRTPFKKLVRGEPVEIKLRKTLAKLQEKAAESDVSLRVLCTELGLPVSILYRKSDKKTASSIYGQDLARFLGEDILASTPEEPALQFCSRCQAELAGIEAAPQESVTYGQTFAELVAQKKQEREVNYQQRQAERQSELNQMAREADLTRRKRERK